MAFDRADPSTLIKPEQELRAVALSEAVGVTVAALESNSSDYSHQAYVNLVLTTAAKFEAYLRFGDD